MEARLSVPKSNNDNPNMTYTALHTNRARNAPHRNPVLICFSFQDVAREGGDASWCEKETQELRRSTQHWGTTHLFLKPDFDWVHCSQCLLRILLSIPRGLVTWTCRQSQTHGCPKALERLAENCRYICWSPNWNEPHTTSETPRFGILTNPYPYRFGDPRSDMGSLF